MPCGAVPDAGNKEGGDGCKRKARKPVAEAEETAEEHAAREEHDSKLLKEREYVEEYLPKGELILDITSNPNEEGEYYDMNSEYTFKFDEVRSNNYRGFEYYLPVMNGKCKRIKNKSIKITDGEIVDDNVLIHAFEVLKK